MTYENRTYILLDNALAYVVGFQSLYSTTQKVYYGLGVLLCKHPQEVAMAQFVPEKRILPLGEPPQEKSLALTKTRELETYNFTQVDRIERKGVMRRVGKSERGGIEKGVVIYAMLRCYSCRFSSRVSFYYNALPDYVKCQGCGQIFPFGSYGCWMHSNEPF